MLFTMPTASRAQEYTAAQPLTLKLTSFAMPTHPVWIGGYEPWAAELKDMAQGRLILELYSPNTICSDADVFDCVKNGVVDISGQISQRVRGTFPLSTVIDLPFLFPSAKVAAYVYRDLLAEFPEFREEFKDYHILSAWSGAPYQIHSSNKELKTLDDLKGLKIGCVSSSTVPQMQALGAHGVLIPTTDMYVSLQRGQVDAVAAPYAFMVSTKVYEAAKYSLTVNLSGNGMPLVINKRVYEAMPEDLRGILDETAEGYKLTELFASVTDIGAANDKSFILTKGQIVHDLTLEDREKGRLMCAQIVDSWLKDCDKRGKGDVARVLYARAQELSAKYVAEFQK